MTETICTQCGSKHVVIHRKYNGQKLCSKCFRKSIEKQVLRTIKKEKLVTKGDKVLVGLSGGKDSVALLKILNILKEKNIITLEAVTIDEGISGYREEGIRIAKETAKALDIKHHIVSFKDKYNFTIDKIMEAEAKCNDAQHACTYCGVFRRQIFNQVARDVNATKLATGHNLDDETQSIVMNYLEGNVNNMVRIGYKTLSQDKRFTQKIKPLRKIPEKEIGLYVLESGFEVHFDGCPYAHESFRMEIGDFIRETTLKHPTIMYSILNGFEKIKPAIKKEYMANHTGKPNGTCKKCGEPASQDICKSCKFLEKIYEKIGE
ncbi:MULTISPECIES: TIGR00269 family protein [Methanosphaera]|uniref:Predicted ATPase n=2 Tax=Methanosphaera stadtmanae TaxID=2317 RepID=Q2NHY4_METST|nr:MULTISPECIES: TIGR00269 family protein [Methanosphaera]ABC56741.1 predicted ATPase [Methanosphaera stadtmanae DSM 3091]MDO5822591.1 TIGR00269 family protein [Methanosphaera sp.]MEE0490067.1 TIGR00269 family protein [Methanosphaera stadtmanae]OEC89633.1 TIGR00269 family protein [Methanosphaera sp. A6]RAP03541.1 tRNA lysidine(34) synthetase TilS [Methanosphaera stadtmanae]